MADELAGSIKLGPAAAGGSTVVETFPAKLGTG